MTELASLPNPFRNHVVLDAWQDTVDLTEIHADAFEACKAGIDSATRGIPDSLLIYGAAGAGKTHLLGRLQRHLSETARSAPDSVLRCVFSFVRLQTSPQLLWQHVRRRLVADLMRREQGLTQLQRLVAHQLGIVGGASARAGLLKLRVLRREDRRALLQHLRELGSKLDLPRNVCTVLEHLVFDENERDASAWLAGESLPVDVLGQLGLGEDQDEDREDAARIVVTALCRLAGETLPIVFCFDQVESLQRTATDEEALFRFGRMAADLNDADPNVFIITCLQAAFVDQFRRAVRQADQERIARRSVVLNPLTQAQVEKLVRARLEASHELQALRAQHPTEPLYPLDPSFIRSLPSEPWVPRRVLALAARAFEERQSGRAQPPPPVEQFLGRELNVRQAEARAELHPADTERILVRGAELIAEIGGGELIENDSEKADFVIAGDRRTAVSVRNEVDGRSLVARLADLVKHTPRKDGAKLVVVRDARLPIPKKAVKSREHLSVLQKRGVGFVEPTVEALAALDALAGILGDAKSGDLANEGSPLDAGKVIAWLKSLRGSVELEPVEELAEALFSEREQEIDTVEQDLVELLGRVHVAELEAAALELKRSPEEVLKVAHKATAHCLVLEGPPTLLLDVSGVVSETEVAS